MANSKIWATNDDVLFTAADFFLGCILVSDIAVFVLKRYVKLQQTNLWDAFINKLVTLWQLSQHMLESQAVRNSFLKSSSGLTSAQQ